MTFRCNIADNRVTMMVFVSLISCCSTFTEKDMKGRGCADIFLLWSLLISGVVHGRSRGMLLIGVSFPLQIDIIAIVNVTTRGGSQGV